MYIFIWIFICSLRWALQWIKNSKHTAFLGFMGKRILGNYFSAKTVEKWGRYCLWLVAVCGPEPQPMDLMLSPGRWCQNWNELQHCSCVWGLVVVGKPLISDHRVILCWVLSVECLLGKKSFCLFSVIPSILSFNCIDKVFRWKHFEFWGISSLSFFFCCQVL
jgi:hypothetical protein